MFESETFGQRNKRLRNKNQANYRKRQKTRYGADINSTNNQGSVGMKRHELGSMDKLCIHCGAKFWMNEKDQYSNRAYPSFTVCCAGGKVRLSPLFRPPSYLMNLYTSLETEANTFHRNVRSYNSLLACTSFGADVNEEFRRSGVSNFTVHADVYHFIGSLVPNKGQIPKFA